MSDTHDLAVRLLRTYADVHTPEDADVARLARRLARSRAALPRPRGRPHRGIAVAALASAAAAVLVLGLVDRVEQTADEPSARPALHDFDAAHDHDRGVAAERSPVGPAVVTPAELPAASPALPAPIRRDVLRDADTSPRARTDVTPRATTEVDARAAVPGTTDGLAAEALAIRRIADAVRVGAIDAAARDLAAYHRAFPRGTLRDEAEALDAIVACRRGRSASARASAGRLLERRPDAAFARRVRDECELDLASNPTYRTESDPSEQPE